MLCRLSRAANRLLTGRRTCICTDAHVYGWRRAERLLNIAFCWRDWRNHCGEAAKMDAREGVLKPFGLDCRRASQEDREAAAMDAAEVDQRARMAGW